jgi:hypothetical protein
MGHTKVHQSASIGIRRDKPVFHKVVKVQPLEQFRVDILFEDGTQKKYDVAPLFSKWEAFFALKDIPGLFEQVRIEPGGYAISWNDEIDLSADELWQNGA